MRRDSGRADDSIYRRPTDPEAQQGKYSITQKELEPAFDSGKPIFSKNRRNAMLIGVGAIVAFALLITIPSILSREPAEQFGPPEPAITQIPAPDPFTFEAVILTDSLAYALEGALTGPVTYSAATLTDKPVNGSVYSLNYDGSVIESHPPQVTLTRAELLPEASEDIPRIPIADVMDLMAFIPESVLVDGRELPAKEDRLYIEAPITAEGRTRLTYTIPYHAEPLFDYRLPPEDQVLFVYGGNDQEALECGAFLKKQGYESVISLGSISEYTGALTSLPPYFEFQAVSLPQETSESPEEPRPIIELCETAIRNSEELAGKITVDLIRPGPSAAGASFLYRHSNDLPIEISVYFDLYRQVPDDGTADPSWSLVPKRPQRGFIGVSKDYFYPPFERGNTYSHRFDFWHDYPDLASGDYRLVYEVRPENYAADDETQDTALMMTEFTLDTEATRARALIQKPTPSEYASIPGLTAKVHPYAHSTGDAWVTVNNRNEGTSYILDGKYEIHQLIKGQWLHMATINDPAFGGAGSVSTSRYYIWEPIIGPLDPGRYRIVHPLHDGRENPKNDHPQALTISLTITEDTGTEKQDVFYEIPTDETTFNLLSPFTNEAFTVEITELTPGNVSVTLTNTSEEIQYYSSYHHLLRRMDSDAAVPFFDPATWHYLYNSDMLSSVSRDVQTVEPGGIITIEADLTSSYGGLKRGEYILSFEMNNPYGPSVTRFASVMFVVR